MKHNGYPIHEDLELPGPTGEDRAVNRKDLWIFMASQETTLVSPAMFDEFIVQYQLPIIAHYGLCAYGCCEDLTQKIDVLRQIPNLRRIAVTPWADLARCAEQIGRDYVISWRPSPAEMVCTAFDRDRIRRSVRDAMEICRGLNVEVTLKDVQTVGGDFNRLTGLSVTQIPDHHRLGTGGHVHQGEATAPVAQRPAGRSLDRDVGSRQNEPGPIIQNLTGHSAGLRKDR